MNDRERFLGTMRFKLEGVKRKDRIDNPELSMPQFLEFPVKNREDFEKLKFRMNPDSDSRFPENWKELCIEYQKRKFPLELIGDRVGGFFGPLRGMIGGIDKRVLKKWKKDIEDEVKRVSVIFDKGGFIPMIDHSVPPDVPFENFCYFIELLKVDTFALLHTSKSAALSKSLNYYY